MRRGIFRRVQMKERNRKIQCFALRNPGKVDKLARNQQASHLCHYLSSQCPWQTLLIDYAIFPCWFWWWLHKYFCHVSLDTYFKILGIDAQMKAQPKAGSVSSLTGLCFVSFCFLLCDWTWTWKNYFWSIFFTCITCSWPSVSCWGPIQHVPSSAAPN